MSQGGSIADVERILVNIQEQVFSISEGIEVARQMLNSLQNAEIADISSHDGTLPELNAKLSDAARHAIENSEGPLNPENFKKFLMEEAFGKPKPDILPIVRQYTTSIEELINQLINIKETINQSHSHYKEKQRKLDENLNRRIDRLVANMKKELEKEAVEGRCQTSMDTFLLRETM